MNNWNLYASQRVPHNLFVMKMVHHTDINDFDIVLTGWSGDEPLIYKNPKGEIDNAILFEQFRDIIYNKLQFSQISNCLDYHFEQCENKKEFLDTLKDSFEVYHLTSQVDAYSEFQYKKVKAWFAEVEKDDIENLPSNRLTVVNHKIALLYELGVIDHLQKEYFSAQSNRTNTSFAKLISEIIGQPDSADTIRKNLSNLNTGSKNDPNKSVSVTHVKTFLSQFGIDLKRLKQPD
ncbi:MAG: hypothetical protein JKY70_09375 [Mucilaginibacter sp.]|nr:hypothetical protein [Mucilaginibacter sp.]